MSKKSGFFGKLLKKCSCFHSATTASESKEQPLVIHVRQIGEGGKETITKKFEVPLKYVTSYATIRALLERSGEDLKTILSRGSVVIRCEIAFFESRLKSVKAKEREAACKESSYDERLWSWNPKSKSAVENSTSSRGNGGRMLK